MKSALDLAQRYLGLADRDITAFNKMKDDTDFHPTTTCFHAQQGIEKCLKAVLVLHGVAFRKTHDLDELVDELIAQQIPHPFAATALSVMNPYAVLLRYEEVEYAGVTPAEAAKIVMLVRSWAGEVVAARLNR
jgi:HEPN domain-containing protein